MFTFYFCFLTSCKFQENLSPLGTYIHALLISVLQDQCYNTNLMQPTFHSLFLEIPSTYDIHNVQSLFLFVLQENHCHQRTTI